MDKLKRNKHQPTLTESSTSYRYKQIRSFKNRIKDLQSALQELTDEINDPDKREHYQDLIDQKVKKFRPFKKTSKFRGVSWHGKSGKWRSRLHVKEDEVVDYHDTELEAALAYDEKVKEHYPDRLYYKNFVDEGETQEDLKKPDIMTVPEKRRAIGKYLEPREVRSIHPLGLGYFNGRQCDIAIKYIEKKEGIKIG